MAESQQDEKRSARRFALRLPITVNHGEKSIQSETAQIRDVSARGISFYLESTVTQGSPIGFTMTLPPEITLTEGIRVECKGHVVRVDEQCQDGRMAVAAVIEEYEFLPEA
jgi:PilZ domain